jgi:heme A synthase
VNWNSWIRQFHRWVAIVFTSTVILTFIALAQENPIVWISYAPLFPLALLLITGLYLFALPYLPKRRGAGPATG